MTTRSPSRKLAALLATGLVLIAPAVAVPTTDGIFATFNVSQGGSPLGSFTAQLDYQRAPRTVANFIGLAEGSQTWIDPVTFAARSEPFYEGIIIHRVVSGFVIQGGSPQGDGSDGPGYTFPDEFDPALRHDAAGILSMANSGLNSNGSQFFVTLAATPGLDDVHNVFGTVVEGLNVVQAIGATSVDGNSKPLTDVVIDSVTITRNGTDAQNFEPSAQPLPRVEESDISPVANGAAFDASYTRQAGRQYFTSTSTDLNSWTPFETSPVIRSSDTLGTTSIANVFDTATEPKGFLRQTAVRYPDAVITPPSAVGKQLVLTIADGGPTLTYIIAEAEDADVTSFGSAQLNTDDPGDLTDYFWLQEAYRARFLGDSTTISTLLISLVFETETSGNFSGRVFPSSSPSFPTSGTFTFGDAP